MITTTEETTTKVADAETAAAEILPIQRAYGCRGSIVVHLNKPEAPRPTGFTIGQQSHVVNRTMGGKQLANLGLRRIVRKIAYVNLFHVCELPLAQIKTTTTTVRTSRLSNFAMDGVEFESLLRNLLETGANVCVSMRQEKTVEP